MRQLIVSLTTTSKRLHFCRTTLISLTTQSILPKRIIINVSKEPYLRDEGIKDNSVLSILTSGIPKDLKEIIELRWVKNTGPYRKLIPTLQQADNNDIIITADDDIFYDHDWLKLLVDGFEPDNKIIHAGRVRRKRKNSFGQYTGYVYWPIIKNKEILKDDWIITYGGGAVLCRDWFSNELIGDSSYLDIAPTADDLWYSKLCQHSGLKVKVIPEVLTQLNFIQHNDGLTNHNFSNPKGRISTVKHLFFDLPLNYFGIINFGNDIAYNSIEKHFSSRT